MKNKELISLLMTQDPEAVALLNNEVDGYDEVSGVVAINAKNSDESKHYYELVKDGGVPATVISTHDH